MGGKLVLDAATKGNSFLPNKIEMATLRKIKLRGKWIFRLDLGKDVHGQRLRTFHKTKKEGAKKLQDFNDNLKKGDRWWATKLLADRASVSAVCIDIEKSGHTLLQVWSRFKEDKAADDSMITPMEFHKAVTAWKQVKLDAGKSQRYVDEAEQVFLRFAEGRTSQFVHRFTFTDLEAWEGTSGEQEDGKQRTGAKEKKKKWSLSTKKGYRDIFEPLERLPQEGVGQVQYLRAP